MERNVDLRACALGLVVKLPACAVNAGNVFIKIIGRVRIARLARNLLRFIACFSQIHIQRSGDKLLATIAATVGLPTQYSRLGLFAKPAATTTSAAISGSKIGGTGCVLSGMRFFTQSNCVVFIAGICTAVILTLLPS